MECLSNMPSTLALSRPVMDLGFIHVCAAAQTFTNNNLAQTSTNRSVLNTVVLSMNIIPPLPQRERTHVTTPRCDTRSSP